MIIIGIIISIILFSLIVIIHEWGHFKAARIFGVKVEEFGIGIPPRAKKLFTDKKGTLFSLNWLPIGGFVKLKGENPNTFSVYKKDKKNYNNQELETDIQENKDIYDKFGNKLTILEKEEILKSLKENRDKNNMMNKPAWQQSIIILAGIFMNFVLAFFIFFIIFLIGVKPIGINTKIETSLDLKLIPNLEQALERGILKKSNGIVISPVKSSLAEKSGLKIGDIILKIDEQILKTPSDFQNIVKKNIGKEIVLYGYTPNPDYKVGCKCKEKESFEKKIMIPKTGKIGIYIGENITLNKDFKYKFGILDSVKYAALETKNQVLLTFKGVSYLGAKIFTPKNEAERQEAISEIRGPIGITHFISNSFSSGIIFLLIIGALISINLGVFNLLPIPALDGGRFVFIVIGSTIKKLFGKKIISTNLETIIHFSFFIILIALSIVIGYNDIVRILQNL